MKINAVFVPESRDQNIAVPRPIPITLAPRHRTTARQALHFGHLQLYDLLTDPFPRDSDYIAKRKSDFRPRKIFPRFFFSVFFS